MEDEYLAAVKKYSEGAKGKRGVDLLTELFARLVLAMEDTREGMQDVLGDLFVGAIRAVSHPGDSLLADGEAHGR